MQRGLMDRGERIWTVDILIAGTAAIHDKAVLTRNYDDFRRVDEISVEGY